MERLNVNDITNIMENCKKNALSGHNPKKTFTNVSGDALVFDGCVFDTTNDRIPSCDVYTEKNGNRNYLYCTDYMFLGDNRYQIKETGSINDVQREITENEYCY